MDNDKLSKYPRTDNFYVKDTIGVPHPYMITQKHVVYAADHCGGMLNDGAIKDAERNGAKCGICKGELSYEEHKTALVVMCHGLDMDKDESKEALQKYLLSIKDMCEKDGYIGFAFMKEDNDEKSK